VQKALHQSHNFRQTNVIVQRVLSKSIPKLDLAIFGRNQLGQFAALVVG
jgi:hypothetical protein